MAEVKNIIKRFLSLILIYALVAPILPAISMPAYAETSGEVTGLTDANIGLSFSGDAEVSWSADGYTITGSAVSKDGGVCGSDTHYSSTLTIINKKSVAATLLFSYSIDLQGGTIQVDGTEVTEGGDYSKKLAANETAKIYIKSKSTSADTKISISEITLVADTNPTVTFMPAENGSYTADGEYVREENKKTNPSTKKYSLQAIPDTGYQFKGWRNVGTGKYINSDEEYSLVTEEDCMVTADFVKEEIGLYEAGDMVYEDLESAINYASSNAVSKITLLSNAIVEGTHTIPAGITLLIPFDEEKTLYKEKPEAVSGGTKATSKSEFRRLTLADGAKLIVNGGISVGGRYRSVAGSSPGYMSGNYGQIMLKQNSEITVGDGGTLYAWGFISGEGSVVAEAGSAVHEWYQIMDFRGGWATLGVGNKVFPFSQYSVQNIESSLTLEQGANEFVYAAVFADSKINYSSINFIGDNGLFKVVDGSFSKEYDGATDRMNYTIDGTVELNNLNLSLAGSGVSSQKYVLPVTNNTTINLDGGSKLTVNQDTALLAGTITNIASNSELVINNRVYVYDRDEWMANKYACIKNFYSIEYAPSKTYARGDADITDAEINNNGLITVNGALYTTEGGANICSSSGTGLYKQASEPGTETVTYQYTQSGTSVTAHEIPITPAKLQDGAYCIETAAAKAGDEIKWGHIASDWSDGEITKAATCTETGIKKLTCKNCGVTGTEIVAATGHSLTMTGAKEKTCTEDGNNEYWTCDNCDKVFKADKVTGTTVEDETMKATGHSYGAAEYTWTDKGKSCTAEKVCSACKHKVTETATVDNGKVTSEVKEAATCGKAGTTTYTAEFEGDGFANQTKDVVDIAAINHKWGEWLEGDAENHERICLNDNNHIDRAAHSYETAKYTWAEDGKSCKAEKECTVCSRKVTEEATVPNEKVSSAVKTKATCTANGTTTYTAKFTIEGFAVQTKEVADIEATGHDWDSWTEVDANSHKRICKNDGNHSETADHSWNDGKITKKANCTEAGVKTFTCTVCNATRTEAVEKVAHTAVEVEATAAKCTVDGNKAYYTCSECKKYFTDETCAKEIENLDVWKKNAGKIEATGHKLTKTEAKNATCEETGNCEYYTCSACDKYFSDDKGQTEIEKDSWIIAAKGHQLTKTEAKDAACTVNGNHEYWTCDDCNKVFKADKKTVTTVEAETIVATGHKMAENKAKNATCTGAGNGTYYTCSACDKYFSDDKGQTEVEKDSWIIAAKGHQLTKTEAKDAACTVNGNNEYWTCDDCNKVFKADKETETTVNAETIAATGHSYGAAEYTWTDDGKSCTAEKECTAKDCDAKVTEEATVNNGEVTSAVKEAATCEKAGTTTYTATFAEEGFAVQTKEVADIEATGHDWDSWTEVDADGHERICKNDKSHFETADHSWDDGKITKEANCTEAGVKTFTCTVCNATRTEAVEKVAHTAVEVEATAAKCTVDGSKAYYTCSECKKNFEDATCAKEIKDLEAWKEDAGKIEATGHSYGVAEYTWANDGKSCTAEKECTAKDCDAKVTEEATVNNGKVTSAVKEAATCEKAGTTTYTAKFTVEGFEEQIKDIVDMKTTGHSWDEGKITTPATCLEDGVKTYTCSVCKDTKTEAVTKLGHDTQQHEAKEAACTEKGWAAYETCTRCNYTTYKEIPATGHTEKVDAAVAPTCTGTGLTEGKHCSVCEAVLIAQEIVPATGHTEVIDEAVKATCEKPGLTEGKHCSVCNAVLVAQEVVQATGHKWDAGEITTSTTCEGAGEKTFTCQTCGETKKEAISASGHTVIGIDKEPASCTEAGHEAGTKCSVCGAVISGMDAIPATGHTEVIDEAEAVTCTENGLTEGKHCSVCDAVLIAQREIPATGHTEVIEAAVAPTCTETGLTEGRHCSVCNAVLVAQEVVPAAGHSWSETYTVDTKASCTEKGSESIHCRNCSETKNSREIPATGHIYKDGKCENCGKAKPSSYSGGSAAIVKPSDNIVNKQENQGTKEKASTTATIASTSSGTKATAEINSTTANKIVEKAVENKSAEIVIAVNTVKTATMTEISISADSIKTITEKTDANLVIKAGENKVDLDKAAVAAVIDQAGSTGTVAFEVETVKSDQNICNISLKVVTAAGTITDFGRGTVAVTVTPAKELAAKNLVCVYINEKGVYSKVTGKKNDDGTFTFMAGRF